MPPISNAASETISDAAVIRVTAHATAELDAILDRRQADTGPESRRNRARLLLAQSGHTCFWGGSVIAGLPDTPLRVSVAESCKYRGVDFLDFLRSGETDIATFARPHRNAE
jgi:hypothetical protein